MEKQKDLTWLEHLQKNSWEPEVIISGISLAFLFVIPSRLLEYSIILIQDYGLEQIPALMVLGYSSLIVSVFKIFLISHLFLRFLWAGLLGITYAFPEGVKKEKLFKFSQNIEYPHPNAYLIKLERWCSMAYGFPISTVIPIFFITLYLIILISIYLVFELDFQLIYFLLMGSLVVFFVIGTVLKESKLKTYLGKSMNGTVSAVYQSNLGKWTILGFTFFLVLAATPLILSDLTGFSDYQPITNLDDEAYDWPNDARYFEGYNSSQVRFPRIWTENKVVSGNQLNLYLAQYTRDEWDFPKLQKLLATDFDTLQWGKLEQLEDSYRIFLNDSLIQVPRWDAVRAGISGQKALFGTISIAHLSPGTHEIKVEKLVYIAPFLNAGNELRHRKRWARFNFIKE